VEHSDIVIIGASAGGLEAIRQILAAMPQDLGAAILIVLHTANHPERLLPQILKHPRASCPFRTPETEKRFNRGMYTSPLPVFT
jgi:two-component system chemotaxis response regulator CheB